MKLWPVLGITVWAASAAIAADTSTTEFAAWAPPDCRIIFGLDVHGMMDSPMLRDVATQSRDFTKQYAASGSIKGFDPQKDVDRVLVFVTNPHDMDLPLMVLRGRFDAAAMAPKAAPYRGVTMIESPQVAGVMAIVGRQTALIGRRKLVEAAIDRHAKGARIDADVATRIASMSENFDIWGIGEHLDGLTGPNGAAPQLPAVDRFSFGAAMRHGFDLTAEFHAASAEDRAKLQTALGLMQVGMAVQAPEMAKNGLKFDMRGEGETLQVMVTIPEVVMEKVIREQGQKLVQSALPRAVAQATPRIASETPPRVVAAPPTPAGQPSHPPTGKTEITRGENGDTTVVKLPGGR